MASLEILVENLNRIARKNDLRTYKEMADYFNVKETALKRWENKSRCPSLKQIDKIADKMKCYSYALIQKNGELFTEIGCVENRSREILVENLRAYFLKMGRLSWNERTALFYGFVSEDALKSYFIDSIFKTTPLNKLDEMAEALGIPTYKLIREKEDEKDN